MGECPVVVGGVSSPVPVPRQTIFDRKMPMMLNRRDNNHARLRLRSRRDDEGRRERQTCKRESGKFREHGFCLLQCWVLELKTCCRHSLAHSFLFHERTEKVDTEGT